MEAQQSNNLSRSGILILIAVIICWGTSWPILKIGLNEIPPLTFRGLIAPSAAILLIGIAITAKGKTWLPTGQWRPLIIASLLNVTGWHALSAFGLNLMGSGQASIIAFTMPLWAMIFSMLFIGERPTVKRVAGLIVGLIGLGVLLLGDLGVLEKSPLGVVFMLVSAIAWGAGTVAQKRTDWKIPAFTLVGWQFFIGALPVAIAALIIDAPHWEPVSASAVWSTAYVLVFPLIVSWYGWFKVVKMVPVSLTSVSTLMVPVIGVISGNVVLSELIGWREAISLILVCSSLALVMKKEDGS